MTEQGFETNYFSDEEEIIDPDTYFSDNPRPIQHHNPAMRTAVDKLSDVHKELLLDMYNDANMTRWINGASFPFFMSFLKALDFIDYEKGLSGCPISSFTIMPAGIVYVENNLLNKND
jgi:hypothetical protein